MHTQEIKDHVAGFRIIGIIHRYFPEIILQARIADRQGSQSVPQIIQHEQTFCTGTRRLIFQSNKRATQLDRIRKEFFIELFREVKQVGSSQHRLTVLIELDIRTAKETITTQYLFIFRTPDDQLTIGILHRIELVDIYRKAGSPAIITKCDFTQTPDFLHYIRRVMGGYNIYFIV